MINLLRRLSPINNLRLLYHQQTWCLATSTESRFKNVLTREISHKTFMESQTVSMQDYALERERYRLWEPPEYFNFARDVMDVWAEKEKLGEKRSDVALWLVTEGGDEVKLSYQDLSILSRKFANVLTGMCGLQREDCMLVVLRRVPQWWVINLASIRCGVVMIPGTVLLTVKDLEYRVRASGAKCVITSPEFTPCMDEALQNAGEVRKISVGHSDIKQSDWLSYEDMMEQSDDTFECVNTHSHDPMLAYFTSGTTGLPKLAQHSHGSNCLGNLITARYSLDCTDGDVMYNLSDLGWAKAAYSSVFGPWMTGATVFQHDTRTFNADVTLKILSDYGVTNFCAPPTAYRQFITRDLAQFKFKALRHCTSAGEPVNAEILELWKAGTGLQIYEFYGQTETTSLCSNHPCVPIKPGSMGKPSPGYDIEIVDKNGTVLPRGEEGEIGVRYKPQRPIGLFLQYVGDEEKTSSVFVGDFYLTGDRAIMDDDGYIWFVGRNDDVILSSGYRIGPFEIESVLLEHPAVLESAVVSSPDPVRGEVVKAFVILNASHRERNELEVMTELQEYIKVNTAPYKYPRKIEFVDELPKTISGKIRRIELRHKEWSKSRSNV